MNCRLIVSVPVLGIMAAALTFAQSNALSRKYTVYDLGPAGNPFSSANAVNRDGVVAGSDTVSDGGSPTSHAVLWYGDLFLDLKQIIDAQQPGLLGPNSGAALVNDSGLVLLGAETLLKDPHHENFCAYGKTGLQCVAMLWSKGILTPLPNPLGGTNSGWGWMNNRGEVAGYAENTVRDPKCLPAAPNGTGPQIFDYEAVIWGPAPGQFRRLPPLPGDSVALALGINDAGETVGISGGCGNTVIPPGNAGPHAVLWETNGTVHDLGSFGGTSNPAILGVGNGALAINDEGVVVGTSAPPGNTVNQPFLWTKKKGMQHLALLPGDVVGAGLAINNRGEVVGASISPGGLASGTPSAVVWQKGTEGGVTDLNLSLSPDSSFIALLTAFGINDKGQIAGFGMTSSGDVHAFLANPCEHDDGDESAATATRAAPANLALSESVRRMISGRLGIAK